MDTFWATPSFDDWSIEKWQVVLKNLSENGFLGIEPMICGPYKLEIKRIKNMLGEFGLKILGFRTGGIAKKFEVFFNHSKPIKRKEALERFIEMIHYAAQFGNPKLLVGLIQGNLQTGQSPEEAESFIGAALHECADIASQYGMEIDLEPVNHFEINHHNTIDCVINLINSIGCGNISLLVDTYHMNIEEAEIEKTIETAADRIGHVHLADSNRSVPGMGDFDFKKFFRILRKIDYKGCMTIEAVTDSSQSEIEYTMRFLKKITNFVEE